MEINSRNTFLTDTKFDFIPFPPFFFCVFDFLQFLLNLSLPIKSS